MAMKFFKLDNGWADPFVGVFITVLGAVGWIFSITIGAYLVNDPEKKYRSGKKLVKFGDHEYDQEGYRVTTCRHCGMRTIHEDVNDNA
jgi:hypothetical protein